MNVTNLLDDDFSASWTDQTQESSVNSELAGLSWPANTDLLTGEFMPSKLLQEGLNFLELDLPQTDNKNEVKSLKINEKSTSKDSNSASQVSWLSLFAELDPLANQNILQSSTAVDTV